MSNRHLLRQSILEIWKFAPVTGEPYACCTANGGAELYWDLPRQAETYHLSNLGNGNLENSSGPATQRNVREAARRMGSRIVLDATGLATETYSLTLLIRDPAAYSLPLPLPLPLAIAGRAADGSYPLVYGTLVDARGATRHIAGSDIALTAVGEWSSARTGTTWPSGWRLVIASIGLNVAIQPEVLDQELDTRASTGVIYWEGASRVVGSRNGLPIQGRAYVELTGYARAR